MVDALGAQDVDKLGQGSSCSHDAEEGQEHVPCHQRPPHLKPGSRTHVRSAAKDEQEVETHGVGADSSPVLLHPWLDLGVLKVGLEPEHVGVVGHLLWL